MPAQVDYREYWNRNIENWGEFYLEISHGHETLSGPAWFSSLYRATIGRIERRLMAVRYARTVEFLDKQIKPGTVFSDIGCGTGIFVVEAAKRGAVINAIDFTESSLAITRKNVAKYCADADVRYVMADVQNDELPRSDVALAMGLTPYIADISSFLDNVLPKTSGLFCLYLDPDNLSNRFRRLAPFLNVRGLHFHPKEEVDRNYARHGWSLVERRSFGTGYIDFAVRGAALPTAHPRRD